MLGNAGLRHDDDGTIHMSAKDYEWWCEYIRGQEAIKEAAEDMTEDERTRLRDKYPAVDFEDEAGAALDLIAEIKAGRVSDAEAQG